MISIERVKTSELNALVSSPGYHLWEVIPISLHRAKSYVNNPRASASDTVLYLAYLDGKLVGYRTILPDEIHSNGETIRIGWLSGNWVNPKLRRMGVATALFEAAYTDWEEKLLFTNYALGSKAVYDKSSRFELAEALLGRRLFLRPCLAKILPTKGKTLKALTPLWVVLDFMLRLLNPLPLLGKMIRINGISIEYLPNPDQEVKSMLKAALVNSPTARTGKELDWIFNHPWLVSSPLGDRLGEKYYFSSSPKCFEQCLLKIYRSDKLLGFIMINNRDGFLSTPYVIWNEREEIIFAKVIIKQALAMGCDRVTTYHSIIAKAMKGIFPFGLVSIKQQRNFYATRKVVGIIEKGVTFAEGDGDCSFV